jgi:hypothetical protein
MNVTKPKVLNKFKDKINKNDIFIGRPSIYGNPYIIGLDGDRLTVIKKYTEYLKQKPSLIKAIKNNLKGKNLVCFCAPLPCHGDLLLKIANENLWDELIESNKIKDF